jgi:hypothetical protein
MGLAGSTRRQAGWRLGLLVAGVLVASHALSVSASAQTATPAFKPNPAAQEQKKIGSTPQTEEEWRNAMSRTPPPHKGCFKAAYPKMDWTEVQCVPVSGGPHYPASGTSLGNNNTSVASSIGDLSSATGSFDSVTGLTSETDSISGVDRFSLQLNTNFFPVSLCNFDFCGWLQFVFWSFGCTDNNNPPTDCVYIEYWLRDWALSPTNPCPSGWMPFTDNTDVQIRTHCIHEVAGTPFTPHLPITSLKSMSLTGSLQVNSTSDPTQNNIFLTFGAGGEMGAAMETDFLDVGANFYWTEAEFNVFGQDQASEAKFNPGTTLVVRTQIQDRLFGNVLPTCHHYIGFTRETNNLNVVERPTITKAPLPSIAFKESNVPSAVPPDCATSLGDTHLMTFDGCSTTSRPRANFCWRSPLRTSSYRRSRCPAHQIGRMQRSTRPSD